jgi:hypothetical protein
MQVVDLDALPLSLRIVFKPVLVLCRKNAGRRCIFPGALKIKPKNITGKVKLPVREVIFQ